MQTTAFLENRFYLSCLLVLAPFSIFATPFNNPPIGSVCDVSNGANIIGLALGRDSEEPLYCEYHFNEYDGDILSRSVVKYIDTNKQQIAEKKLDYSFAPLAPNVVQRDTRQGELRAMTYSLKDKNFLLEYKKNNELEKKSATIDVQNKKLPVVADAGFDILIKENWSKLLSGTPVDFSFLSPIHTRKITLRVSLNQRNTCGGNTYDAEQTACFTVKPKSSWLKVFAKPMLLSYSKTTKQLEIFSGVVNLVDEKGQAKVANIYYWHKP